jgi:hypothetical protein|tara:strand:- start:774 stop:938 length:165 start_codon:yes stop_codon:yes gene_type:complete
MKKATTLFIYRDELANAKRKLKWWQFKKRKDFNNDIKSYTKQIDEVLEEELLKY